MQLKKIFEEEVGTAVDDRRHSTVVHTAKATSVRDLREKIVERCVGSPGCSLGVMSGSSGPKQYTQAFNSTKQTD